LIKQHSKAYAPAHITGFFKIYENGSTGAGINPKLGAVTKIKLLEQADSTKIRINSLEDKAPVSNYVIDEYLKLSNELKNISLEIDHSLEYPSGFGMGMSGAGAFSLSLALNELLDLKLDFNQCMEIAKLSDIKAGTGLGDVIAQKFFGLMIGRPPYPSSDVEIIPTKYKFVTCGFFASISTSSIIKDEKFKERINSIGSECMDELEKNKTEDKFIELCRHFTKSTKIASKEVLEVMENIPQCSMSMLGQSVFLLTNDVNESEKTLKQFCKNVKSSEISTKGAHVIR